MRVIEFNDEKIFDLCYEGLITTSTSGIETRLLARVLTKLEEIGVSKGNQGLYTLAQAGSVLLEEAEYALVKKLINTVQWNGIGAKNAAKLLDLIEDSLEEKKVKLEQ